MAIKEIKREWSPCQLDYVKTFLLHSEKDVKDLPKCCVGSKATVSETDNEYFCTESGWKLGSELGGGGEVVILPETEFPGGTAETQIPITTPLSATPTAGATAKVTYNGKDYDCPIVLISDNGYDGYVMGNIDALGVSVAGGNPDAPFAISLVPASLGGGVYGIILSLEEVDSITISIVQVGAASGGGSASAGGGGLFVVNLVKGEQMEESPIPQYPTAFAVEIDKTFAEVLAAFKAGSRVECREASEDGSATIYQPIGFGETTCMFSLRMMAFDFVVMIMPDGTAIMLTND